MRMKGIISSPSDLLDWGVKVVHWRMMKKRKPKESLIFENESRRFILFLFYRRVYIHRKYVCLENVKELFMSPSELSQEHKEIDTP